MNVLKFEKELEELLNRHSAENESDTPDFVLAQYLTSCLLSFSRAEVERTNWYKSSMKPPTEAKS